LVNLASRDAACFAIGGRAGGMLQRSLLQHILI
jgi:hypothetical protein